MKYRIICNSLFVIMALAFLVVPAQTMAQNLTKMDMAPQSTIENSVGKQIIADYCSNIDGTLYPHVAHSPTIASRCETEHDAYIACRGRDHTYCAGAYVEISASLQKNVTILGYVEDNSTIEDCSGLAQMMNIQKRHSLIQFVPIGDITNQCSGYHDLTDTERLILNN